MGNEPDFDFARPGHTEKQIATYANKPTEKIIWVGYF